MPRAPRPHPQAGEMNPTGGVGGQDWYPSTFRGGAAGGAQPFDFGAFQNAAQAATSPAAQTLGEGGMGPGGMSMAQFYDPEEYAAWVMEQDPNRKAARKQAMDLRASQKMQTAWQSRVEGARGGAPGGRSSGGNYGTPGADQFSFLSTHQQRGPTTGVQEPNPMPSSAWPVANPGGSWNWTKGRK